MSELSWQHLKAWRAHVIRGPAKQVTFGFGHDFREVKMMIVEAHTGKVIAEVNPSLDPKQMQLYAALLRQTPILYKAVEMAVWRLGQAKHPNAVKLREMLASSLTGLEVPVIGGED